MRKINTVLSVLLIIIFGIHGVMGGFMLIGTGKSAGKVLAWIGVGILAVHAAIGIYLTVKSLKTAINTDKKWDVTFTVKVGDILKPGDIYATVKETRRSGQDEPADLLY